MTDEMREHIKRKEEAYLARKAGQPMPLQPIKKYWWETEEQEGD
jgi:hypothetical protein